MPFCFVRRLTLFEFLQVSLIRFQLSFIGRQLIREFREFLLRSFEEFLCFFEVLTEVFDEIAQFALCLRVVRMMCGTANGASRTFFETFA